MDNKSFNGDNYNNFYDQEWVESEYKIPRKSNVDLKKIFVIILFIFIVAMVGVVSYQLTLKKKNKNSNFQGTHFNALKKSDDLPIDSRDLTGDDQGEMSVKQIYEKAVKSTVGIVVYDTSSDIIAREANQGTGVIIRKNGYIVTNSHIINNSKDSNVTVVLNGGEEIPGTVVGIDNKVDLAVIKIDHENLNPIEFGDSDKIAVGEWVVAIGNPGGLDFVNSLTRGIVSSINRSLGTPNLVTYIQTDAAINPGNSGGALMNMDGKTIGISSSKISAKGYEGMSFSIPSKTVKRIVDDIINQGYVSGRVHIGAFCKEISAYAARLSNIPQGVIIDRILKGSDLVNRGIKDGDIITKVDQIYVTTVPSLINELTKHKPGDEVTLTLCRVKLRSSFNSNSSTFETKVTLLEDKGQM